MAAHKIRCFDANCKGVPFAVNDAAARIAEQYFGRIHYKCDKCGSRWSITPKDYLDRLAVIVRV
jgi:hypothetical protein